MSDTFPGSTDRLPDSPQLSIYIDALAVMCFNTDLQRAEVGFLDREGHDLYYWITDANGIYLKECGTPFPGDISMIGSPDDGLGECLDQEGSKENYEHLMDLTRLYGTDISFREDARFRSRLHISGAVFSTAEGSLGMSTPVGDNGSRLPPVPVGRVLSIKTKTPETFLRIGSEEMRLETGGRYTMMLRGTCPIKPDPDSPSDFIHFHDILSNAGSVVYDLKEPSGLTPWLTKHEEREFAELGTHLNTFLESRADDGVNKLREDVLAKVECLKLALRCKPADCAPSVVTDRPRRLPT